MFLVPLLWLPPEERTVDILFQEINTKYGETDYFLIVITECKPKKESRTEPY